MKLIQSEKLNFPKYVPKGNEMATVIATANHNGIVSFITGSFFTGFAGGAFSMSAANVALIAVLLRKLMNYLWQLQRSGRLRVKRPLRFAA
jgi:hypothetical protein